MAWNLWTNDLPKPSDSWPDWKGRPVLDAKGRKVPMLDENGEAVLDEETHKKMYEPNLHPEHSLPPLNASDAWGRGEALSAQHNRDRLTTFRKGRQRTPGM